MVKETKLTPVSEGIQLIRPFKLLEDVEIQKLLDTSNPDNPYHTFVGQEDAIEHAKDITHSAFLNRLHSCPENIGLTGGPGLGKTEWARRLGKLIDLPVLEMNGADLQKGGVDDFFQAILMLLKQERMPLTQQNPGRFPAEYTCPPLIVFVDEAHAMPKAFVDKLLTATESPYRFSINQEHHVWTNHILWLLATTEWGDLFKPLRTRFRKVVFHPYTAAEVGKIVRYKHPDFSLQVCEEIAGYTCRQPRQAIKFARGVTQFARRTGIDFSEACALYAERKGVDKFGITKEQRGILVALQDAPNGLSKDDMMYVANCEKREFNEEVLAPLKARSEDRDCFIRAGHRHYITDAGRSYLSGEFLKKVYEQEPPPLPELPVDTTLKLFKE